VGQSRALDPFLAELALQFFSGIISFISLSPSNIPRYHNVLQTTIAKSDSVGTKVDRQPTWNRFSTSTKKELTPTLFHLSRA